MKKDLTWKPKLVNEYKFISRCDSAAPVQTQTRPHSPCGGFTWFGVEHGPRDSTSAEEAKHRECVAGKGAN